MQTRPDRRLSIPADSHARSLATEEAFPAIYRAALCRFEWHRGFPTALRARGHGLGFGKAPAGTALALGFTVFAALRLILEIFIVEEVLFSRCENEICSAVYAL
jgi:hypothetical protein